jgi:CheY-like chemotaxis protein
MVHGFVKQSGGHVRIYSEAGHGTTAKIYLPRSTQAETITAAPAAKSAFTGTPLAANNERILLVEDNEGVCSYAKEVLTNLGYRVTDAGDGDEAMRYLTDGSRYDLLFTDVVLPGKINGRALADQARKIFPGIPVLFTTGYTRNAIVHQGRLDPDVHLINKPYTQHDLARKIHALLGEKP